MSELIIKMVFWLLASTLLGFFIGWFYSKAKQREKYIAEIDSLNSIIRERELLVEKLEKRLRNQKVMINKLTSNYERSEEVITEKIAQLNQMKIDFDNVNSNIGSTEELEKKNLKLLNRIESLEKQEQQRINELMEFEKVLIKAEETIEEKSDRIENLEDKIDSLLLENEEQQKTTELYRETIADFEKELKLYSSDKDGDEFIITKDQFTHIEEQLVEYQKEIESLKKMNSELIANNMIESKKNIKREESDVDDGSVAKIFKDTYKKITKN